MTTNVLGVEHCGCYYADCREGVRCHTSHPIEQTLETMFKRPRRAPKLSAEEMAKRAPLPVEMLASGALQDRVHDASGPLLGSTPVVRVARSVKHRGPRQPKE